MPMFFSSTVLAAHGLILAIWSMVPLSWTYVSANVLLLVDGRHRVLPASIRSRLDFLPSSLILDVVRFSTLAYAAVEVIFSIYHYLLIRRAQTLLPPHHHDQEFLRNVMHRALGSGMASTFAKQGPGTMNRSGSSDHHVGNGYALRSRKSASTLKPPNGDAGSPSSIPSRPVSPGAFAPVDVPLAFDDPRAEDFRQNVRLWFHNCPWQEIGRENVFEWLCWSLYGIDKADLKANDENARREGREKDIRTPLLEESLNLIENRAGVKLPPGRNDRIKTIRLTLDPVNVSGRPFALYAFTGLACWAVERSMRRKGFRRRRASRKDGMEYLTRIPEGWTGEDSDRARPLIFLHGLGIGLAQYATTLHFLADSEFTQARPVMIPMQPHISMSLLHPSHLRPPSKDEMTGDLLEVMKDLGFQSVDVLGHSNGTIVSGWIVKALSTFVRRLCLVDPVCFCLWEPQVCYNFLYSTPKTGIEVLMRYFVGTELGVALTLQRHFNWASNILWPYEIPGFVDPERTTVFLAGNDGIINARRVRRYLLENGMRDADSTVLVDGEERTRQGDNEGGGGLVVDWKAAHGESLISGGKQFGRIVRWLKGEGLGPSSARKKR